MGLPDKLGALYKFLKSELPGEENDLEARIVIQKRTGFDWAAIIAHPEKPISTESRKLIEDDLHRRKSGEPLSRIYGEREFWGRVFKISPHVLDPRPDTETLVARALEVLVEKFHVKQSGNKEGPEILDLGIGSGAILLTLLAEMPGARGIGVDISPAIFGIVINNAKSLEVDQGRFSLLQGDWGAALGPEYDGRFDLIVSNPPYIARSVIPNLAPEVRNHDPILALDGGEDGLEAYKKIFSDLNRLLKPAGKALLEIGFDQADAIRRLGRESRIRIEAVHLDIAGRPRVVEITCGDK